MSFTLAEEPGKTTYGTSRPRVLCWIEEHDGHGLFYKTPVWLPEGDKPEIGRWVRAPWMDEPPRSSKSVSVDPSEDRYEILVASCRDCPFTGESDGEAVTCEHAGQQPLIPFGLCEDSWAKRTPPPEGCPLRREPVRISLKEK